MAWEDRAACRAHPDPDVFFEVEESRDARRKPDQQRVDRALEACAGCAVRTECGSYGERTRSVGIWGGELVEDRKRRIEWTTGSSSRTAATPT